MLEPKEKTITRYYLEFGGKRIKHSTKRLCVAHGKALSSAGYDIKMIEEYDLWLIYPDKQVHADHQVFDRTETWLKLDIDNL